MSECWFDAWPTYSGVGTVVLGDPSCSVRGEATASLDEFGILSLTLEVDPSQSSEDCRHDILAVLIGGEPTAIKRGTRMPLKASPRSSTAVKIDTPDGAFEITSGFDYAPTFGDRTRLRFQPLRSRFTADSAGRPAYWVIPLVNFVSEFRPHEPGVGGHVLRINQTYETPIGPEGGERDLAWVRSALQNRFIGFEYSGEFAFIEPLSDYANRKSRLLSGTARGLVTAVMVGHVPQGLEDVEDVYSWVPLELTLALSLATGVEVRPAWIELRDAEGRLCARHHTGGFPCYSKGYRFIDEGVHRGTGHLLTRWLQPTHLKRDPLHAAVRNIVLSGHYGARTLDDGLRHAAVSIEMLCKSLNVRKVPSMGSKARKRELFKIIDGAQESIEKLAAKVREEGASECADAFELVAGQINTFRGPRASFGETVTALIRHEEFPDADIVCSAYERSPWHPDFKTWERLLGAFRGKAMHGALLEAKDSLEVEIAYHTTNHLRDLAVRSILKEIGYNGRYQPSLIVALTSQPFDWVKSDFSLDRLGYEFTKKPLTS